MVAVENALTNNGYNSSLISDTGKTSGMFFVLKSDRLEGFG